MVERANIGDSSAGQYSDTEFPSVNNSIWESLASDAYRPASPIPSRDSGARASRLRDEDLPAGSPVLPLDRRGVESSQLVAFLVPVPEGAGEPAKPSNPVLDKLIAQLGHDDFETREAASAELIKRGSAAWTKLAEATKHPDVEIARRAERAQAEIIAGPLPRENQTVADAYQRGLQELAKTGKISDRTQQQYQAMIREVSGAGLTDDECLRRRGKLIDTAYHEDAQPIERISARKKLEELYAAERFDPSSQARTDYADLLTRSGEPGKALDVLRQAVERTPRLAHFGSFVLRASAAGAGSNNEFLSALEKLGKDMQYVALQLKAGTVRPSQLREHLSHETARHGLTPTLEKQWRDQLAHFDKLDAADQDPSRRHKFDVDLTLYGMIDALTYSGRSKDATACMIDLIRRSPEFSRYDHISIMSELNGSSQNPEFVAALEKARSLAPKRE